MGRASWRMRGAKRAATIAVLGCCFMAVQGQALAAPGDVDPSFGTGGVVETPQGLIQGHLREFPLGMAIGPRDEIFVLGAIPQACPGQCPLDLEVTRYSRDGSRDTSFGSGGRSVLTVRPGQDLRVAASIAVGGDGKVVVATTNGSDMTLLRLTPGGALDPTFGGTGVVPSHFAGRDQAAGVAVQRDGAIVVAGMRETLLEGTQPLLARYTSAGTLDDGFGEGGIRILGFAPDDFPAGLALPGQGRVAVGLSDCCYATGRALVARFTAAGALDRGFARQGWRSVGRLAPVRVAAVMPARKGRLLVIGGSPNGVFAARFLSDGRSDMRFGKRGLVWLKTPPPRRKVSSSAVDGAGRLLFASTGRSPHEFGLTRLRTDGRQDLTFAGGLAGGIPGITRTQSLALQSSGRIVVLGEGGACERVCPPSRMVIARYLGGSSGARCDGRRANVVGTRRPERLEGTEHRDVIQALGGDDRVFGFGGNDLICGGPGNDHLFGGPGQDRLSGGPGKDSRSQ
jgi:uncharacterized delta-60 repeat protein